MLTTFALEQYRFMGIKRLLLPFVRDKVTEDYVQINELEIRRLKYISYHKKINWDTVYTHAGYEAKSLVCDGDIHFPYGMGLLRYSSRRFYARMAENFALCVLREMEHPEGVRIAFYDLDCSSWEFLTKLCELTDNFIAVTADKEKYSKVSDLLLNDCGVSMVLTGNLNRMKDRDLIIAPSRLTKSFETGARTVILTCDVPKCELNAQIYSDYKITLPPIYRPIAEDFSDEMYLASALYTAGKQYSLGGVVPTVAFNPYGTVTVKSLAKYLDNLA